MRNSGIRRAAVLAGLLPLVIHSAVLAQRTGFSREELVKRRAALMDRCGHGVVILFGDASSPDARHFRQDNDFFYFTGVEDLDAVCVMIPERKASYLFLPRQSDREKLYDGANLLAIPDSKGKSGFTDILPLEHFDDILSRLFGRTAPVFHLRLSPGDSAGGSRSETLLFLGRRNRNHYNDQITADNHRIRKIRENYPWAELRDLTPFVDGLRVIKSPEEIEILRRNGRISAESVKQAMLAGRPGAFEYEAEAAAMFVSLKSGAKGAAFPPIVGSGPNACVYHYEKNSRRIEDGDLVLMDYGADLDHLGMDITRTWPANGRFSPEQGEIYRAVLEVQKASIEACRPGATREDVRKHVAAVMKKKGIDPRGLAGGFDHYVGMAVHDCGPYGEPLKEGMVLTVEPGLYYPEKNIGVRIEDTVLVTKTGCEVLTKDAPKEIEEIESFLRNRK